MINVQAILDRLEGVKPSGRGQWVAKCPAHDDRKPSLSIALADDKKILLHCHAGCSHKEILDALGMKEKDLFPENNTTVIDNKPTARIDGIVQACQQVAQGSKNEPSAPAKDVFGEVDSFAYDYTDADGNLLYQVLRKPGKKFTQRRPKGNGGWVWNMKEVSRVLYQLPYLKDYPREDWVFVVEGEKDANNLRKHNLFATCNSGGAGKWDTVADLSPLHGRRVAILPDNDQAGRDHALQVAASLHGKVAELKIVDLSGLPEKGDISDWLATFDEDDSSGPYHGIRKLAKQAPDWSPQLQIEASWPDPQPLPEELLPVEKFDPELLPSRIRPWIEDIADRMQCPIEFPAVSAMICLSQIIGRQMTIRPKRLDTWQVVPNLWGMLIGRPSLMKSPPLQEVVKPLHRLEAKRRKEFHKAKEEYVNACEIYDLEKKARGDILKKAIRKGDEENAQQSRDSIGTMEDPSRPLRKRYIVNDVTVEKLQVIMSENNRGLLWLRDELAGLFKMISRKSAEGTREFLLESWDGNGQFQSDRMSRRNNNIEGACLSIIGTIQPGPLRAFLVDAIYQTLNDNGFVQRFQLAIWPDDNSSWKIVDRTPDYDARDLAYGLFEELDEMVPFVYKAEIDERDPKALPFLRFDDEAQKAFFDWWKPHERWLRSSGLHPAMESHLAKFRSLVTSLALILHLADGAIGPVSIYAWQRALRWIKLLESHANRIYSQGIEPDIALGRALGKKVLEGKVEDAFTSRMIYRKGWAMLNQSRQALRAAEFLVEHDWLVSKYVEESGQPHVEYTINPKVFRLGKEKLLPGTSH